MYKYETHSHTSPVSKCAKATAEETLDFYKSLGYDGVFITNHFIDGNINIDANKSYEEKIKFYFSDYEDALIYSKKIGIKVFCGVELSYLGTDFLVYGLDKEWFLNNPQIENMKKTDELSYFKKCGALVIQAHPFREASYIDHIRLFPRCVHGVEVINACRTELENNMADIYAKQYNLIRFAGSDNHIGGKKERLAGICTKIPLENEKDFIECVNVDKFKVFDDVYQGGILTCD